MSEHYRFGTLAVHAGQAPDEVTGAIMPPIYQTSTYVQPKLGEPKRGYEYARVQNPTREAMEANIAALEGALKLKEVSYLHAEGYAAGELKHGPIAMLDPEIPVIAIATSSPTLDKVISNMQEVRARRAPVIAIATEGDAAMAQHAEDVIYIPHAPDHLTPILATIPLQLLSNHVAVARGCDVDQPRNLAKSVTVE